MKEKFSRCALTAVSATVLAVASAATLMAAPAYADTPMQEGAGTQKSAAPAAGDSAINSKVTSALVQDEKVGHLPIQATTSNGIVQLSGFANSADEADRAAQVARQVPGVKDVQNNIELHQSAPSPSSRPGY